MAAGRKQAAARRRREREEHVAKQGEPQATIERSCKHRYTIGRNCQGCRDYIAERERRGLVGNPYRIPY